MHGDFSTLIFDPREHERGVGAPRDGLLRNLNGVLHQQGRVMSDSDLTEGELLDLGWNSQAGRDVMGAGVCAVPASQPAAFRIESAFVNDEDVHITVRPGRAWADGLLTRLAGTPANPLAPVERIAAYFGPPLTTPRPAPGTIADGVRDVVVLEVSQESLHGFQYPERLMEAALGGPDTAARAFVSFRFRLLRLAAGEDCHNIRDRLHDDPSSQGRLTVSLAPVVAIAGDCPVVGGGGYTGFEHNLYRIEIAEGDPGAPARFKWSQWNGGLAGRGLFDATSAKVTLEAGRASIVNSGLTEFYLEALQYQELAGTWDVVYATTATLDVEHQLQLASPATFGTLPSTTDPVFFRLWNGAHPISDFTDSVNPRELRDGIRLTFDAPAAGNYGAGDHWTFKVRAGEIVNPEVLVDNAPPDGIVYHRVPLAEITWTAGGADGGMTATIEDCRTRFRPLTNQKICCTLLVGDGVRTFGDFNSLEEAADHLPPTGGELCLLPGLHRANLTLDGRRNITIHGCSRRSLVMPHTANRSEPILRFVDCTGIEVKDLDLVTFDALAVDIEGRKEGSCRDLHIHHNRMIARTNAISATNASLLVIADNRLHLLDTVEGRATISCKADDTLVERNVLVLLPFIEGPGGPDGPDPGLPKDPADPCAPLELLYQHPEQVQQYASTVWALLISLLFPEQPYRAIGGIHVRAGSERVRILQNAIIGGAGNGITLGGDLRPQAEPGPDPEPVPATAPVKVTVTSTGLFVALVQDEEGRPLADVDVYLEAEVITTDRSDSRGMASLKAAPGVHILSVDPKLRVVRVLEGGHESVPFSVITVAPRPVAEVRALPGLLHWIDIHDNDISFMGLSGIGFALRFGGDLAGGRREVPASAARSVLLDQLDALIGIFALTPLLLATDGVRDLTILRNRIHHNLQNPFNILMLLAAQFIGGGGISLAVVQSAVISGNHVLDNGPRATDPVCGVFVGYGNNLEITDNVVAGNGIISEDYLQNRRSGLRGGIYIRFAGALTAHPSLSTGRQPALRVHDNRVDQPAGRALTAFTFGPVSVANNHFNSEYTGRFGLVDSTVGGVMIFNLGGIHRMLSRPRRSLAGGDKDFRASAELFLPGGETLFDDNFVRVGTVNRSLTGQFLLCYDDLGYASNTSSVYRPDPLLGNAMLVADTVRVTSSRFREDATDTYSLLTAAARLNITSLNQADHCIITIPPPSPLPNPLPTVNIPNQVLEPECRADLEPQDLVNQVVNALAPIAADLGGSSESRTFTPAEVTTLARQLTAKALATVQATHVATTQTHSQEAARLSARYGANHPAAVQLRAQVTAGAETARLLAVAAEIATIAPPAATARGAALSGRFVNSKGQGQPGYTVDLAHSDGARVDIIGVTDERGYFEKTYDEEKTAALAKAGAVFPRVLDSQKREVVRAKEATRFAAGANIQIPLTAPVGVVPRSVVLDGTVISGEASGGKTAAPASAPKPAPVAPPDEPTGPQSRPKKPKK
jgi:hypothetical protein